MCHAKRDARVEVRKGIADIRHAGTSQLAVFNPVITYIPEFDVYVDSTAGTVRFGTLPFNEEGKRALLASAGVEQPGVEPSRLVTLPIAHPNTDARFLKHATDRAEPRGVAGQRRFGKCAVDIDRANVDPAQPLPSKIDETRRSSAKAN